MNLERQFQNREQEFMKNLEDLQDKADHIIEERNEVNEAFKE